MPRDYVALRSGAASRPVDRDFLRVFGADAASYLQGQCSQEVEHLELGVPADALLLSPQGKIDELIRVTRLSAREFLIDCAGGTGASVDARLRRFRLRVDVEIEALDWECLGVRGPAGPDHVVGAPRLALPVSWPGLAGLDLVGPAPGGGVVEWVDDQVVPCGVGAWEAVRIEAGVPVSGREITEASIAAELGLVDRTVSFTKGCFTGQELVARIDSRGSNVARRMCGVVLGPWASEAGAAALVGSAVHTPDGEHQVGSLSSVAWSPGLGAVVALATLHRRIGPPAAVTVAVSDPGDGGAALLDAEARPLPLR